MLNISDNSIRDKMDMSQYQAHMGHSLPKANRMLSWWLMTFLLMTLIVFFLPWTQNIQMKGAVTTLLPGQRPQDVNSAIAGRIEEWYVREGQLVNAGDTIAFISEVKPEYFDPQLVSRTANQITAKEQSQESYRNKVVALDKQIGAMRRELDLKKEQLRNKITQAELKLLSQEAAVQQSQLDYNIAEFQYRRTDTLFQKGIKSLSDLEAKRLKMQETEAKQVAAENKLREGGNDLEIAKLALGAVDNEYINKIAKAESDKFSTLSQVYEAEGTINKLRNQYENYRRRDQLYYIIAPQTGYITETIKSGIGEIIKEGETIVTVVPYVRELAVEMYVRAMDLPLLDIGQEVRLLFDGWQAFIISGWSDFSFGTYSGQVVAIDNIPNDKSLYRILVRSNNSDQPFPDLLRVGAGAQGNALLKNVPVRNEVWRQLNGFTPEYYEDTIEKVDSKFKPPVTAVAK